MSLTPEQIEENWNKFYGLGPRADYTNAESATATAAAGEDAANAAVYSSTYDAANASYLQERELQIEHLKELHAREGQA